MRLWRSENVGPVAFRQLLARFGTAKAALEALPDLAKLGGRAKPIKLYTKEQAEQEMTLLEKSGGDLIASCEPDFPESLSFLSDSPPLLSYRGRRELFVSKKIGIVGARNASANGKRMAEIISGDLVKKGYVIVSGMARGIDAAAHKGALSAQDNNVAEGHDCRHGRWR